MMQDIWKLFPHLMEEKINGLLETAEPNRMKSYQLYKSCQNEDLWKGDYRHFAESLHDFFSLPKSEQTKSRFDFYLDRPMHKSVFNDFKLDFRNAVVDGAAVLNISSWAHNLMRINCKTNSMIISTDVMTKTLRQITNPGPFEKAQDIEFEDFCDSWKRMVFSLYGKKFDTELDRILNELHRINIERKNYEKTERFIPAIYLTQTEIDWTEAVMKAAEGFEKMPRYPLSRGPQKQRLIELEKVAQLYTCILNSPKPELQAHRENVRATLIHRCEALKRDRAK